MSPLGYNIKAQMQCTVDLKYELHCKCRKQYYMFFSNRKRKSSHIYIFIIIKQHIQLSRLTDNEAACVRLITKSPYTVPSGYHLLFLLFIYKDHFHDLSGHIKGTIYKPQVKIRY